MSGANITMDSMISRIDDIITSDIDDEKVMMSIEKGEYYGLEPVGSCIWEMLETPTPVADIVGRMLCQYDVDRETCERDVLAFLHELARASVVRVRG